MGQQHAARKTGEKKMRRFIVANQRTNDGYKRLRSVKNLGSEANVLSP